MTRAKRFKIDQDEVNQLHEQFLEVLTRAGAAPKGSHEVFQTLRDLYSEPHRAYHNLSHVRALLDICESLWKESINREAIFLAIWFHDAVYNTRNNNNEEKSAELAVRALSELDLEPALIARVNEMVLATKHHQCDLSERDLSLFLDLDLSILGESPEVYADYSAAIRQEYSWVPGFLYKRERRKVLKSFLSKDKIFRTSVMHDRFEADARENIRRELNLKIDQSV